MDSIIRIGTRESQLAVWQASQVQELLAKTGIQSELVYIKSEGDLDLKTPLYEIGVQGIFTRSLDIALLERRIDIAVHSMKDVPTMLPAGIMQAAVLTRGSASDLLVCKTDGDFLAHENYPANIATSSIRRKAQWLHRYPTHSVHNLRGNVNTRLKKLAASSWDGAIFAEAGLARIGLKPANSIVLDWMLPAPAQGAIVVLCRAHDEITFAACTRFNDHHTDICTKIERSFLRELMGGCSTPISAFASIRENEIHFSGNILSTDGTRKAGINKIFAMEAAADAGETAAQELLANGGREIAALIPHAGA